MSQPEKPNDSNDSKRKGISIATILNGLFALRSSVAIFIVIELANLWYIGSIWDNVSKNSVNSTQLNSFLNFEANANLVFTILMMIVFVVGEYFAKKLEKFAEFP